MAMAGIGVDLVSVSRMERVLARTPSFAARVFTPEERAYCDRCARPAEHYAARFAAREAVLKALGSGFAGVGFSDVSVSADKTGRPRAVLAGRALELAREQGVLEVALSLSHTRDVAVANAVAVTEAARPQVDEKTSAEEDLRASFKEARQVLFDLERVQQETAAGEPAFDAPEGAPGE